MRCVVLSIICVTSSTALAGCVSFGPKIAAAPAPPAVEGSPVPLRTGDRVRVTVFGEDRLSGDYEIDDGGSMSMPLAGAVKAGGSSRDQLQAALTERLKLAYLKDPKVTVDLLSKRPFYILGEVEKPGEYPYRSGLDIWRAMALAGGQTYRASASTVAIQRAGESDFHDYKLAADVAVGPGDVVRVPERWF